MNANDPNVPNVPSETLQPQTLAGNASSPCPGASVEACEFERLLNRAMEILNTRARAASTNSST